MALHFSTQDDIELGATSTRLRVSSNPGHHSELLTKAQKLQAEVDASGFPEGGVRAWLVVFGSFCGM